MVRRLIAYLAEHRLMMAAVIATMLASTLVEMAGPWPLKLVVDNVLGEQPLYGHILDGFLQGLLLALAALSYVLLAALRGSFSFLRGRWLAEISQKASLAMRGDLYSQVQRLSLRFHDRARVGDTVTRLTNDVDKLQDAFVTGLSLFSVDMLTVFGIAVIMFLVDWQFALVAMIVLPPLFLIFSSFRRRLREASRAVRSGEGAMASMAQEVLSSIRVVKAFGQEDREQEKFLEQTRSMADASIRATTWEGMFSFWVEVATAAGIATVVGYGGWRVIEGNLTLGEMLVFMQYLTSLYTPLRRLSRLTSVVQKASASADRLYELFLAAPEVEEAPHALPLQRARGSIIFDGVWFAYEPDRPILRGIDLEIGAGEALAVVGPTGAGKSTLVSLIPRFYDANQGRLLVDGSDVRELRLRDLRDQISIVLQDPVLFSGTIRDNVAYGRPDATDREVVEAARAAHAHEFIVDLAEGYDSAVGERGVTMSGGQRQRIAIARAILKDAPILILDEPTSAVDAESEGIIMEALTALIEGRTVIIIAHRLSTTELADRVAVLVDGAIVETGSLEELRANGHFYRRLYAL